MASMFPSDPPSTDFFAPPQNGLRQSILLVSYFALAVILLVFAVYLVAAVSVGLSAKRLPNISQPELLLLVATWVGAIVVLASLMKSIELRSGGRVVALNLGGRRIDANTADPVEQQLLAVVAELALAAGLPAPTVYLLDKEPGINAFAAGATPANAVIGITRGTLDYLTRDEVQAVVCHVLGEILNGSMRRNTRLMGLLHGILWPSVCGYWLIWQGWRDKADDKERLGGGFLGMIGLAFWLIGYGGLFFGRLIKATVSFKRVLWADESAVSMTGNSLGLAQALKKIGRLGEQADMLSPDAELASHMFCASIYHSWSPSFLATHPPLEHRIQFLMPEFDGQFTVATETCLPTVVTTEKTELPSPPRPEPSVPVREYVPADVSATLRAIGLPKPAHIRSAQAIIRALPEELVRCLQDPFSAKLSVFALLLSESEAVRDQQLLKLRGRFGAHVVTEIGKLQRLIKDQGIAIRLPIIELAQPTLQQLSLAQYNTFRSCVKQLIAEDLEISMFEFVLQYTLLRNLDGYFSKRTSRRVRYRSMDRVLDKAVTLISAFVHVGQKDQDGVSRAYQKAWQALGPTVSLKAIEPRERCTVKDVQAALARLVHASLPIKKRVLGAVLAAITADDKISVLEAELFRSVANTMWCPVPPIVSIDQCPHCGAMQQAQSHACWNCHRDVAYRRPEPQHELEQELITPPIDDDTTIPPLRAPNLLQRVGVFETLLVFTLLFAFIFVEVDFALLREPFDWGAFLGAFCAISVAVSCWRTFGSSAEEKEAEYRLGPVASAFAPAVTCFTAVAMVAAFILVTAPLQVFFALGIGGFWGGFWLLFFDGLALIGMAYLVSLLTREALNS